MTKRFRKYKNTIISLVLTILFFVGTIYFYFKEYPISFKIMFVHYRFIAESQKFIGFLVFTIIFCFITVINYVKAKEIK